jgi:hypothetical protein
MTVQKERKGSTRCGGREGNRRIPLALKNQGSTGRNRRTTDSIQRVTPKGGCVACVEDRLLNSTGVHVFPVRQSRQWENNQKPETQEKEAHAEQPDDQNTEKVLLWVRVALVPGPPAVAAPRVGAVTSPAREPAAPA